MKKQFSTTNFNAKYNESTEVFDVYYNNTRIAVIYEDNAQVRFTNTDIALDIDEMGEMQSLIKTTHRQWVSLNG